MTNDLRLNLAAFRIFTDGRRHEPRAWLWAARRIRQENFEVALHRATLVFEEFATPLSPAERRVVGKFSARELALSVMVDGVLD